MKYGYNFYFMWNKEVLMFPITPQELRIKVDSKNETITLIDEGDINILKSPALIEVEFDARFPMRQYPYSREVSSFKVYYNKLQELKEQKKSFQFIVERTTPNGVRTWDTDLLVALESFEIKESALEGDDVIISFKLKQYKEYGIKTLPSSDVKPSTSTAEKPRPTDKDTGNNNTTGEPQYYVVKSGDCLWNIAKAKYGDGSKYTKIYEANKSTIEAEAKKRGKASSSNGHWIYPKTKLIIPSL